MSKKDYAVPMEIQSEIGKRVTAFNDKYLSKKGGRYWADARGKFIYLRYGDEFQTSDPICRLTYHGDLENMDFAIFKWSTEKYDPNEFCITSTEHLKVP
jgi:hypothetical protein